MSTLKRAADDEGIHDRLRLVMKAAGVNQRQLAEIAGVNLRTIQAWMSRRERRLPADAVARFARALGVSCDYLILGDPAALDPGVLWEALTDPRFAQGHLPPVSEEVARLVYAAYTTIYLETLSRYGRDFPCWDRAESLINEFNATMDRSTDPRVKRLRQRFPDG